MAAQHLAAIWFFATITKASLYNSSPTQAAWIDSGHAGGGSRSLESPFNCVRTITHTTFPISIVDDSSRPCSLITVSCGVFLSTSLSVSLSLALLRPMAWMNEREAIPDREAPFWRAWPPFHRAPGCQ